MHMIHPHVVKSIFFSSCINVNVYHTLTKGEPGIGEKGERGLDGLPGGKVKPKALKLSWH